VCACASSLQIAILLVCAAYLGFFISPAAVPARVAISFLCFLITINNMNSVISRLPALPRATGDNRVWFVDFLMGCVCFNFTSLLSYAAVHYAGVLKVEMDQRAAQHTDAAKRAIHDPGSLDTASASPSPPPSPAAGEIEVAMGATSNPVGQAQSSTMHERVPAPHEAQLLSRLEALVLPLVHLDVVMRVVFPVCFVIYVIVMHCIISFYSGHSGCRGMAVGT
jgi:hypothetical protein